MEEEDCEISTARSESLCCDSCGKNVMDEDGSYTIGASITIDAGIGRQLPYYRRQLGKYKLGKTYNFCWECYLDSYMRVRKV